MNEGSLREVVTGASKIFVKLTHLSMNYKFFHALSILMFTEHFPQNSGLKTWKVKIKCKSISKKVENIFFRKFSPKLDEI